MTCLKNEKSAELISSTLKKGGIAILPTDTVYGFSGIVDYKSGLKLNTDSKIKDIKGRDEKKPLIQLISSPDDIRKYSDFSIPEKLTSKWPGALTIIVPVKKQFEELLGLKTVAFRCPGDKWLRSIIEKCGEPIYSTSVNLSGKPNLETFEEILCTFGDKADIIVDDGEKKGAKPSTLVLMESESSWKILRQGDVAV